MRMAAGGQGIASRESAEMPVPTPPVASGKGKSVGRGGHAFRRCHREVDRDRRRTAGERDVDARACASADDLARVLRDPSQLEAQTVVPVWTARIPEDGALLDLPCP